MDRDRAALETYLRWFAGILLLASFLPFDFYGNDPVWAWEGFLDGGWADRTALLLPAIGGVVFFLLVRLKPNKLAASSAILMAFGLAWVVSFWSALGPHPLGVYQHLAAGLPPLFGRAWWLLMLGTVLLATGMRLGAKGFLEPREERPRLTDAWRLSKAVTGLGVLLTVLFYLLPYRGAVPVFSLVGGMLELGGQLRQATEVALLAGQVLSLGPLLFALASMGRLWRRAPEHGGALMVLLLAYLPVLSVFVGLRNLIIQSSFTLLHLRSAALMLTLVAGATVALSSLLRGLWFEVPWSFGRLTRVDRMLAATLSESGSEGRLDRSLNHLHPLVRPFVRRRLLLWKSAVAQVPGSGEKDPSRLMRFLDERSKEEQDPDEDPVARWPGWMRGHWLTGIAAGATLVIGFGTLLAAYRTDAGSSWRFNRDDEVFEKIFQDEIPNVVAELSRRGGAVPELVSFPALLQSLSRAEAGSPGILDGVVELLDLGAQGRKRLHSTWRVRDKLNHLLQENGVPYFVRSRIRAQVRSGGEDVFYLLTYRVTDCLSYRLKGTETVFRVLHLARADRLNVLEQYVGATDEEDPFVSILIDRVELFINQQLTAVARRKDGVGDAVREGLLQVEGSPDLLGQAEGRALGAFLIEGLTRHELHHKWMGLDPDPPTALWARMSGYSEESVRGVASELGAFLGELGYQPAYARVRIALMLDAVEELAGQGGSHGMASVFLLQKLLGIELQGSRKWRAGDGQLAVSKIAGMDDRELTRRIQECHQELFGVPQPVFCDSDSRVAPIRRHEHLPR